MRISDWSSDVCSSDLTRGGKGVAARSVTTLHAIFAHAKRAGLIEVNPALGVRKYPDQKKTRRLSRQELRDLGKALRDAGDFEHPVGLAIIRLLVLSGLRLNEEIGRASVRESVCQ